MITPTPQDIAKAEEIYREWERTPLELQELFVLVASALAAERSRWEAENARLRNRIDTRLNDCLCEMKEGYDDSIVGFNEAWDIVRKVFAEAALAQPTTAERE